ncbi:MAG: type III pantothenate kinase [Cocleimonas sp.]|nr:type III pantothenate kinase [Cocleimonas sp.]
MILLADAGNSRLKWSMYHAGKRTQQYAQNYLQQTADHLLFHLLVKNSTHPITQLVLVSVLGPSFSEKIQHFCQKNAITLHIIVSESEAYGVKNSYSEPQRLGADRFVGLIAAHHLRRDTHCIIISCGTAVTIDALTAQGEHLGGLILPGLQQFSDALIKKSALLVAEDAEKITLFAHNTADALLGGRIFGLVEAINGISSRMESKLLKINHLGESLHIMHPVKTIICGGDAKIVHQYLGGVTVQREDDWLMQGLQVIADITGIKKI